MKKPEAATRKPWRYACHGIDAPFSLFPQPRDLSCLALRFGSSDLDPVTFLCIWSRSGPLDFFRLGSCFPLEAVRASFCSRPRYLHPCFLPWSLRLCANTTHKTSAACPIPRAVQVRRTGLHTISSTLHNPSRPPLARRLRHPKPKCPTLLACRMECPEEVLVAMMAPMTTGLGHRSRMSTSRRSIACVIPSNSFRHFIPDKCQY